MSAEPTRNVASPSGGPETPPSGTSTNTPPLRRTAWADAHVLLDADAAAPDREHPAQSMQQPFAPARAESGRAAAQEPDARLERQRMHDQERVHPASMDGGHEQIAATRGQALPAAGLDLEPERPEQDESCDDAERADTQAGLRFGLATEPGKTLLDTPASGGHRLRGRACLGDAPGLVRASRVGHRQAGGSEGRGLVGGRSEFGSGGILGRRCRLDGLCRLVRLDALRRSAGTATTRPGAPQVATSGNVGRSSSG